MKISAILLYVGIVGGTVTATTLVNRYLFSNEVEIKDNSKEIAQLSKLQDKYYEQTKDNYTVLVRKIDSISNLVKEIPEIKQNTKTTAGALSKHIKNQGNFDKRAIELIEILAPIIYEKKNELTQEYGETQLNETQFDENGMLNLK